MTVDFTGSKQPLTTTTLYHYTTVTENGTKLKIVRKRLSNLNEYIKTILIRIVSQQYNSAIQLKHFL